MFVCLILFRVCCWQSTLWVFCFALFVCFGLFDFCLYVCLFFVLIFFRVCCWQSTLQVCPLFARIAIAQNVYASGFVGRGWIYRNRKDDERI